MDKPLYNKSDDSGNIYFKKNVSNDFGNEVLLHFHNAVELKFVTEGSYDIEVGGEKYTLKSGDVAFVGSRRPHAYRSPARSVNYVLVIGKEYMNFVLPKGKTFPLVMPANDNFASILNILEKTEPLWDKMSQTEKRGFVFRILGAMLQYYELTEEKVDKRENILVSILEFIDSHVTEDITLEGLAKEFGYTKNYFSNLFNKYIGVGLREYVNRRRIEKAVNIIKENGENIPLWAVAERCGYKSVNTFGRAYKRYSQLK